MVLVCTAAGMASARRMLGGDAFRAVAERKKLRRSCDCMNSGSALFDIALAHAVHAQLSLLLQILDRHESHVGPLTRLTDGGRVRSVILAALTAEAIRCHELGRDQPHGVAVSREQPGPVMGAGAGLHPNDTGR